MAVTSSSMIDLAVMVYRGPSSEVQTDVRDILNRTLTAVGSNPGATGGPGSLLEQDNECVGGF